MLQLASDPTYLRNKADLRTQFDFTLIRFQNTSLILKLITTIVKLIYVSSQIPDSTVVIKIGCTRALSLVGLQPMTEIRGVRTQSLR